MQTTSVKQLNIFGGHTILAVASSSVSFGDGLGELKLTPAARHLARLLISPSHYMRHRRWEGGSEYIVYKGNQDPVRYFPSPVGEFLKPLLKTDKNDRITFNLTRLRQQDGRTFLKRLYKTNVKPKTCK